MACELPKDQGIPLSRFSRSELHRFVIERGASEASASTIGRWLAGDAIKPWQYRSWIFPRDPDFLEKAGRVPDLYQARWEGKLLEPGDMVICADAKPSIQARRRIHRTVPPAPGGGQLVEHEYERLGAVTYLDEPRPTNQTMAINAYPLTHTPPDGRPSACRYSGRSDASCAIAHMRPWGLQRLAAAPVGHPGCSMKPSSEAQVGGHARLIVWYPFGTQAREGGRSWERKNPA